MGKDLKTKNKEKDDLVSKLIQVRNEEKALRKQLAQLEYEEKYQKNIEYLGRYFKEKSLRKSENDYVRCLFVYEIDKQNCEPMCLCVTYWKGIEDHHFGIEYYSHFRYETDPEEYSCTWEEITKEEFYIHYNDVQRRISESILKGK